LEGVFKNMTNYRTIGEIEEEYLVNHPEDIDEYITALFEEYAQSDDLSGLMSSLRKIARIKGITNIAEDIGLSRKGVQKALSEKGNPQFSTVKAVLHSIGYRLTPQKITEESISSSV
jgi:probable addiction module antidote protein